MRRDVISAYAASGAKVLSWVIVSAVVFRAHPFQYAVLALIRGTVTLLNYTTLGLAPAMVRLLASVRVEPRHVLPVEESDIRVLSYATSFHAETKADRRTRDIVMSGMIVSGIAGLTGLALVTAYSWLFHRLHEVPVQVSGEQAAAWLMGMGIVLRLMSDGMGAVVQVRRSIAQDNHLVIASEAAWIILLFTCAYPFNERSSLVEACWAFFLSGALLLALRGFDAARVLRFKLNDLAIVRGSTIRTLLVMGGLISVAQLADFLYAPTDYILINHLISPGTVARYAPAVQIDAGLLLLVGALATALLPKAALAHAAGEHKSLRRYYMRGTLGSAALLLIASIGVYVLSPSIFQLWLGDPLPATQAILPLVLIHTVVGGSAGVGRSILLGMGKVKPFAVAAIVAGVANVILSYAFVKYFGLGLNGIVYGTIVAVVGRCVVWQPWYVLRTLERESRAKTNLDDAAVTAPPPEPL